MPGHDPAARPVPPPRATFDRLDADQWAALLPHLRAVLPTLEFGDPATVQRLSRAPVSRLAGGRGRRELTRLLSREPALWQAVRRRLTAMEAVSEPLAWILELDVTGVGDEATDAEQVPASPRDRHRDRERLRTAREERDAWRRRAEGAEARAERAEREAAALRRNVEALQTRLTGIEAQVEVATEERGRAVERERRRRDAEVAGLRNELAALRREEEERRKARRRREAAREQRQAAETTADAGRAEAAARTSGITPGRPTSLPPDVVAGTTEAAELLLHRDRRVLVDGYNVTLQHRGALDIEQQRAWLIQTLGNAAAARGIRPIVVFDGERPGGFRTPGRDVQVRFTAEGITADDELVLDVEATDEPVVVVTDDRELIGRVKAAGADVVGTISFLGVVT